MITAGDAKHMGGTTAAINTTDAVYVFGGPPLSYTPFDGDAASLLPIHMIHMVRYHAPRAPLARVPGKSRRRKRHKRLL